MKATINRIAILAMAFLPYWASAQHFPSSLLKSKPLPQGHPKVQPSIIAGTPKQEPLHTHSTVHPVCAFDEMNAQHCLENPNFEVEMERYLKEAVPMLSKNGAAEKSMLEPLLTISVVVHVIHNGEPIGQGQNISDAQVLEQIAILNEDYTSLNSQFYNTPSQWMGAAGFPNIQFCLANKKPDGSATNGIDRKQMTVTGTSWNNNNVNSTIKPAIRWDPNKYYNIYVLPIPGTTALGGVVGYSNYPLPGQIGGNSDGVVIDYRWFGGPSFPVSGYRPLTHETGHYLGLPHPFNGNSCSLDDGIGDTPNIDAPTRDYATLNCEESYPGGPMSCGNEHMYVNYMDYVTENCYTSFTAGQANVMRAVLNGTSSSFGYGSRNGLIQNAPLQCSIPATDAGITRVISPINVTCTAGGQLTPTVSLRNFGTANLTSTTIFYKINDGATISNSWQGSLFPGQNMDVNLAPFNPMNGGYTLTVWTSLPNGQVDQRPSNDSIAVNRFTFIAAAPPSFEDVEGESGFPTSEGILELNVNDDLFAWAVTDEASAFGEGGTSFMFDNYNDINLENPYGTLDALVTRHFNFSNISNAMLKFDVAYAPYFEDEGDSLLVLVATNCSQNFNQLVFRKGGVELSTSPISSAEFTPTSSEWRTEFVDLSAYDGASDVTIAIVNLSAFGNRLFIDNIGIGGNCNAITTNLTNLQPDDCAATCSGAATIQVANTNGALQYQWQGFPGYNQASNSQLCMGTTNVTVTDAIGCQTFVPVQITGQQAPSLSTTSTQVTTYGVNNGTATVNVTGGAAPYSYVWSNGFQQSNVPNTSSTASMLAPGNYSVIVTDGNSCSISTNVTVGSVCSGFSIGTTTSMVGCFGGDNGSAIVNTTNGTAPFSYNWSNGQTTATASSLTSGTYSVTVSDANGCPASGSATITQPTALTLMATATAQMLNGMNDGTASVSVNGGTSGYNFLWSNGATTAIISNLSPGNYGVTVTDANGCTAMASTTVNPVNCGSFSSSLDIQHLNCFGENNGTALAVINGGSIPFAFNWSNGETTQTVQGLQAGQISVSILDGQGCIVQLSGMVNQPLQLLTNAGAEDETVLGAHNGSASVSPEGGNPPYSLIWSNGSTNTSIVGLSPGVYGVTLTDANGCITTDQSEVGTSACFISLQTTATPTSCPTLADGTATATIQAGGTGPFDYLWSNGETTNTISQLTSGTYSVTVSDALGCSEIGQVTVSSSDTTPPTLVLNDLIQVSLDDNGFANLEPSMLIATAFDNCSMVFYEITPSSVDCDDLGMVQVTVTATDNSGNISIGTAFAEITDNISPTITCPADLVVNTCEAISYANPTAIDNCGSAILELVSGLESGVVFPVGTTAVTWSATDAFDNVASCTFQVVVNSNLTISTTANGPSCHGYSDGNIEVNVTGGQPPYDIFWGSPNPLDNLSAGTYSITVTDDVGCSKVKLVQLTEPDELGFTVQNTTPATVGQSNGTIEYTVTGGTAPFTLNWLQGGVTIPNFNPLAAPAGSYQARVVDNNGCIYLSGLIVVTAVSATIDAEMERRIAIAPNPSTGLFNITTDLVLNDPLMFTVYDGTGRKISFSKAGESSKAIDLQAFSNGVYWAKLQIGEAVVWKKLVKI